MEEYESDELADDSGDEKKLRSPERRALSKLRDRNMQSKSPFQACFRPSQETTPSSGSSFRPVFKPFRPEQSRFHFFCHRHPQPTDKCVNCEQFRHWANSPSCPSFYGSSVL